ncbi:GyrI-like domain-containing protein [Pseudoalteromonas sp. MMG010]|uniref:GyrI-like domain-containing protein n=1 Tax=Pseudoalteromonas sp. MMG010 TaxID=2822685 RepID=UPI001B3A6C05|nr:GyrI-like domain-containing protein [Pseudoalteromonas sp. MMG010]MBQ4833604.1 GyrI-like domain-containing protein [Pseudoalteromonas sp. MMG010]
MEVKNLTAKALSGMMIRTCNADEMNPAKAKIGALWQDFAAQCGPQLNDESKVYGVYCNYENDMNGYFDVIAGTDTGLNSLGNLTQVTLTEGGYLVFSKKGKMPEAVIALWGEIWQYFNDSQCPHIREYQTDYEFYKSENEIDIAIGIKTP